jgi:hypothetical protein
MGLRAGLDDVEIRKFLTLPGLKLKLLGRSLRIQSRYAGCAMVIVCEVHATLSSEKAT